MRQLFNEHNTDRLLSKALAEQLAEMEERPWPEWKSGKPITVRQIARLLSRYDIMPNTIRTDTGRDKGYKMKDCIDAFESYLPLPDMPKSIRDTVTKEQPRGFEVKTASVTTPQASRIENASIPNNGTDCHGGTDEKEGNVHGGEAESPKAGQACGNPDQQGCIGRLKDIGGKRLMCGSCHWSPIPSATEWAVEIDCDDDEVPF